MKKERKPNLKKYFLISICLVMSMSSTSFAGVSQAGVLFLKIGPGARPGGMGEAFVAVADDATATYWNPAGLAYQDHNELTMMHVDWLPMFKMADLYYDYISYVHVVPDWGTFGTNIVYLSLGETERTSETGATLGRFSSYEFAITGSYGSTVNESMAVGVNMRFIYSHLSDRGAGSEKGSGVAESVGVDIGWLWDTPHKPLRVGANLSNMGPKVAYIDRAQADPLPTNLKFGIAYDLVDSPYNSFTFVADVNKELVRRYKDGTSDPFYLAFITSWEEENQFRSMIYNAGFEYWYTDLIALRAGYWHDEEGKVKPKTFGASLQYSLYRFDFSYIDAGDNHPLTDTMRFSLSIGF